MNEAGPEASVLRPSSTLTSTDAVETITLSLGQGHLMEVGQVLRIALGSGRVLQANWLDDRQLLLIPEAPGETTLHLWLKGGGIRKYQILVTESNSVRLAQVPGRWATGSCWKVRTPPRKVPGVRPSWSSATRRSSVWSAVAAMSR